MSMRINQSKLVAGFRRWTNTHTYTIGHRLPGGLDSLRRCPSYPRDWRIYAIGVAFWVGFACRAWIG